MYRGHKVVAATVAGRRRYMEIQLPYLLQNRGLVDKHQLWMNTWMKDDVQYLRQIAAEHADFIELVEIKPEQRVPEWEPGDNYYISLFPRQCIDPQTIYIRFDDDICYIAPNAIEQLLRFRLDHPEYFFVFPMIINNGICSHFLQQHGRISSHWPSLPLNSYGFMKSHGIEFVKDMHKRFLDALDDGQEDRYWVPSAEIAPEVTFSVNCICWLGSEFAKFNGEVQHHEERWLAVDKPVALNARKAMCGTSVVAHYSYHQHHTELTQSTDILERYRIRSEQLNG